MMMLIRDLRWRIFRTGSVLLLLFVQGAVSFSLLLGDGITAGHARRQPSSSRTARSSTTVSSSSSSSVMVRFMSSSSSSTSSRSSSNSSSNRPRPIDAAGWPDKFPAKDHCSRCGLCETTFVSSVKQACALLPETGMMHKLPAMEEAVHGASRDCSDLFPPSDNPLETAEEGRFGVLHEPVRLARGVGVPGAQWTGAVTGIALSMLESGQVDAVVCIASSSNDDDQSSSSSWSSPEPIVARTPEQVLQGRGVKPSLAPSLKVLDEIQTDKSIRNLLFCGVGCAVQAFRAIQDQLDLDHIYVLGTNCVDNSPTPAAADDFLRQGLNIDSTTTTVRGYEFMQDFKVHVKTVEHQNRKKEDYIKKPYFSLPGTIAAPSIATSCLACFDYTNALADVVVGYMGAPLQPNQGMEQADQTLTIRNAAGAHMVQTAVQGGRLHVGNVATGTGRHEKQAMATTQADSIVQTMVGGNVPDQGLPIWVGEVLAFVLRNTGPKGIHFARYSIDYHILRNYLHVVQQWGLEDGAQRIVPPYAQEIVQYYLENESGMQELLDKVLLERNSSRRQP